MVPREFQSFDGNVDSQPPTPGTAERISCVDTRERIAILKRQLRVAVTELIAWTMALGMLLFIGAVVLGFVTL